MKVKILDQLATTITVLECPDKVVIWVIWVVNIKFLKMKQTYQLNIYQIKK